ncbi:MAG: MobA/MobL family protein [Parvularcula sp.]|jgi:hypothetical protein|nr:MobA/MobL family protein [Parvularcula sp.]
MAIYSLNLKSIGRTTHAAGTAGAHLLYIARPEAKPELMAEHMPTDPREARTWMNRAEMSDRKNARVADKVRIALPRELTSEQRRALVQDFAQELTKGQVPWFAAIHAQGKDALNPHVHLVIRDRDIETGKRVLRLSDSARDRAKAGLEPKAVEWVRSLWEHRANQALEAAGHDVRIDRRTLEAQGIDRAPTIHIGPQAIHVEDFVERPHSKIVETGNGRSIDYPQIDAGRTRKDRHAEIVDFNLEKAARSPDARTRDTARLQREQAALDRALEDQLIREARYRTQEARKLASQYRTELRSVRQDRAREDRALRESLRTDWHSRRSAMTERHVAERQALAKDQGRFGARVLRVLDLTGSTRRRQEAERLQLRTQQTTERTELIASHRTGKAEAQQDMETRYAIMRRELKAAYGPQFENMREAHRKAAIEADHERQMRAAERDQAEQQLDRDLAKAERLMKQMQQRRDQDRGLGR